MDNVSMQSTRDLLSQLIGRRSAKRLFKGKLTPLFAANGKRTRDHDKLCAARELVERWLKEEMLQQPAIESPKALIDYLRVSFKGQEYESFIAFFLDAQHRLITTEELFRGTLTQTSVYPREVVKRALYWNAGSVIFAHNHPSGVAEPSAADRHLTEQLKKSLALVDVKVLDHFVVATSAAMSFAERGIL